MTDSLKAIALLTAGAASACFNPNLQQGVPCAEGMQCPEGQICHTDLRCYDPDEIPEIDPDATLSALEVSAGTLVPDFDPEVVEYTLDLGLRADTLVITPTATTPDTASIEVAGNATTSGEASTPLDLQLGDNLIEIVVRADDGSTTTYSVGAGRGLAMAQAAYVKASNAESGDVFGGANDDGSGTGDVAISGDTIAITASGEDSNATVVNGDQDNNNRVGSGAVYIFVREETGWTQQAFIKPSDPDNNERFGTSSTPPGLGGVGGGPAVALDGDTLVVGTHQKDGTGGVNVFVRTGTAWSEQAILAASNAEAADEFGLSVAVSGDTIAVGAPAEDSSATAINGSEIDNAAPGSGAVYTFVRNGVSWQQEAYIKASNTDEADRFGTSLALDGDTLVVGALGEDSSATTVNGNQSSNNAESAGAAYVFVRSNGAWGQQAYLKATNAEQGDVFGASVSVDANTLVVGAPGEDSFSGAAYVFTRTGSSWFARAFVKASNAGQDDRFGSSVSLAGNGLLVGAVGEDSSARGLNADVDEGASFSGSAYLFIGFGADWSQLYFIKASNTEADDQFGVGAALGPRGLVLVAPGEKSAATGVNGGASAENDNSANSVGAAYIFE